VGARANDLEALRLSMEDAAANGDFERAADLRDRISLLRGASRTYQRRDFDPTGQVVGCGGERRRIVAGKAANLQRSDNRADLVGLELDIGGGDDCTGRNVDAGEAQPHLLDFRTINHQLQIGTRERHRTAALLDIIRARCHPGLDDGRHSTAARFFHI
jgi:hypothetical protein